MKNAQDHFEDLLAGARQISLRLRELLQAQQSLSIEALLFTLERMAWSSIELGNFWVYQERVGIPLKENEAFEILSQSERIGIDLGRRMRNLSEARKLSSRFTLMQPTDSSTQENWLHSAQADL